MNVLCMNVPDPFEDSSWKGEMRLLWKSGESRKNKMAAADDDYSKNLGMKNIKYFFRFVFLKKMPKDPRFVFTISEITVMTENSYFCVGNLGIYPPNCECQIGYIQLWNR